MKLSDFSSSYELINSQLSDLLEASQRQTFFEASMWDGFLKVNSFKKAWFGSKKLDSKADILNWVNPTWMWLTVDSWAPFEHPLSCCSVINCRGTIHHFQKLKKCLFLSPSEWCQMCRKFLGLVFSPQIPGWWLAVNYIQVKANKATHSPTFFFS